MILIYNFPLEIIGNFGLGLILSSVTDFSKTGARVLTSAECAT